MKTKEAENLTQFEADVIWRLLTWEIDKMDSELKHFIETPLNNGLSESYRNTRNACISIKDKMFY